MQRSVPSAENLTTTANLGLIKRRHRFSASREFQLFGRLLTDICNVPLYLLPGGMLYVNLTKARPRFYVMNKSVDSKTVFKLLDAQLFIRRVRPNPAILLVQNSTVTKGSLARYNLTSV